MSLNISYNDKNIPDYMLVSQRELCDLQVVVRLLRDNGIFKIDETIITHDQVKGGLEIIKRMLGE